MKNTFCILLLAFLTSATSAQSTSKLENYLKVLETARSNFSRTGLTDTNQVALFAIKVETVKQEDGNYKVTSVTVNDSIAYKFYPNLNFVKKIDYKIFARNRASATFIMPMAVLIHYPTKINAGLTNIDDLGKSLVKYMYLHDENGNPVNTSDFIYLPLGIMKTTTESDW